jgi:hypothetical protein
LGGLLSVERAVRFFHDVSVAFGAEVAARGGTEAAFEAECELHLNSGSFRPRERAVRDFGKLRSRALEAAGFFR